ncbi:MAG: NFACT family protein [Candidatus Caccosoma sp.]|nr:NFACT family protein [Candidatus Caccosoma sp.]
MALDYIAFERIISLIKAKIENGKIVKISQISNEEFLLIIRKDSYNYNLLISTHPNMSYINLVSKKPESNHINTNLLMLLRKHLENGIIEEVSQQNDDRIVLLKITNRDDYFNSTKHKLFVELIGKAANLILANNDDVIIDSLKKIPLAYQNIRTIQQGIHYTFPLKANEEQIPYDVLNELSYRNITIEEFKRLVFQSNDIFISTNNGKTDFHFVPLTFMGNEFLKYEWSIGLEAFYEKTLKDERHRQFTQEMEKVCKQELKKSEKKKKKLQEELLIASQGIIYKYYGDLLMTYMQGVAINTPSLTVHDEYENKDVTFPYDLNHDVYYNAQAFYKKYQKSKVAIVKINEQIELCEESIDYFTNVKYFLSQADYLQAMQIKEELINLGYFKKFIKPINNKKNEKKKEKVYKPLAIKYNDIYIYAGQNNLQNEYLTFKMAKKEYMFFHVKQGPGAHVVVAATKINDELMRLAANIAAYYSMYKNSSTVAVNYTLVKNIKKIPGGKPGKVIINNYKTTYVDPDYALFKDLIKM